MKGCTIADKTFLEAGLVGAATSVTDDWDSGTPVQVGLHTNLLPLKSVGPTGERPDQTLL